MPKRSFEEDFERAKAAVRKGKGRGIALGMRNKPKHIEIQGTRWRDSFGNTYHKAYVEVDGRYIGEVGPAYGYGEQYVETGYELLEEKGIVPKRIHGRSGGKKPPWSAAREAGIKFDYFATDVKRKKNL